MTDRNELNELVLRLRSGLDNVDGGELGGIVLRMKEAADVILSLISRIDELERLADGEGKGEAWRYEIQYGPDGEANYAWVYRGKDMTATMRTHHALAVVKAMNSSLSELTSERDALRARVETLEGALKPFARIADMEQSAPPGSVVGVNVDRLRDARKAISPQQGDQP